MCTPKNYPMRHIYITLVIVNVIATLSLLVLVSHLVISLEDKILGQLDTHYSEHEFIITE